MWNQLFVMIRTLFTAGTTTCIALDVAAHGVLALTEAGREAAETLRDDQRSNRALAAVEQKKALQLAKAA